MNKKQANKILEQRIKDYEPIKELKKFIDDSEEKHKQTMHYLRYILRTMEEEYQKYHNPASQKLTSTDGWPVSPNVSINGGFDIP